MRARFAFGASASRGLNRRASRIRLAPPRRRFIIAVARLNPPRAFVGGDSDTIQCAGYGWSGRADFDITALSVYRQCVDLTDIAAGSYVVPAGVSGLPATPHYADQLERWRAHQRIPMHYAEEAVAANARQTLTLTPA